MTADYVRAAQQQKGTYREHLNAIRSELKELIKLGAGSGDFEILFIRLLKSIESKRMQAEAEMNKLRQAISFKEAEVRSSTIISNLIVNQLSSYRIEAEKVAARREAGQPDRPPTEYEVLQKICACGCQDEEDESKCDCPCHKGIPCDLPYCVPCREVMGETPTPHPHARPDSGNGDITVREGVE